MKRLSLLFLLPFVCVVICGQTHLNYHFPEVPKSSCYAQDAEKCYRLIERQAHYLLSILKPWHGDTDYKLLTASKGKEEHIVRPNTGTVAILSFLYRFGPYSEMLVGVSRRELLNDYIIPLIRYLVSVHKTGDRTFDDGKQWGKSWQSAHWTHQLGQGAATIWDVLPADIKNGVLRVVRYEANEVASKNPPYNLTFDSKSEENAWNACGLSIALVLMPDDSQAPVWKEALQRWTLSAYLCPDDAGKDILIDGRPLKEQFEGANIYNDYTLENHGLVHPDYMAACTQKGEIMIDYLATGRQVPDACMYNVDKIYEQLKNLLLPSGGFVYPTGQDWAIFRHCDWANLHAFCLYYYNDPEALYWLRVTLDVIDRMQQRHPDGRIYGLHENDFPSSQTLCGLGLVDSWKMLMLAVPLKEALPERPIRKIYPDGKFFIRRTAHAVHTVSWGKQIQFQSMALSKDPIVAPDWRNGIGSIRLKGTGKDLPLKLQSIGIDSVGADYRFTLEILHGDAVRADYVVSSMANGDLVIHEKLTALKEITTEKVSTLTIGILNHADWIEEKGSRTVRNRGKHTTVVSQSGKSWDLGGNSVVVDGRLTVTAKHAIHGKYVGCKGWKSSKLLDKLVVNSLDVERKWNKGSVINENTITVSIAGETHVVHAGYRP